MFYAAINTRATETSIGFANTWSAIGFATRQTRDAYVKRAPDLATKAIAVTELGKYDCKRGQVSYYDAKGEGWTYMGHGEFCRAGVQIDTKTAAVISSDAFASI